MAEYGIKIRNADSTIQIDSNYQNYVLEKSGSLSFWGIETVSITNNLYPPIAAIRPQGGIYDLCSVYSLNYSDPYYTDVVFYAAQKQGTPGGTDVDFDYRIYTLLNAPSADKYGMRIYTPAGDLVYDSGFVPFKILEVGSATIGTTYTHASHTSPYYIFSPWHSVVHGVALPPAQGPVLTGRHGIAKQSTTSVQGQWSAIQQVGITNYSFHNESGQTFTLILCE